MNLTAEMMTRALTALNVRAPSRIRLIIGGGGAMILAHHFDLATTDIDGIPAGMDPQALDSLIKAVAQELAIAPDWLNPYFSTFTHVLPSDYGTRLIQVLNLERLEVLALSADDLLIMKAFAHRQKDVAHMKALIQGGARVNFVEQHIENLREKRIPGAAIALDFLDDVRDQME